MKRHRLAIAIAALLSLGRPAPDAIPGKGIGYCGPLHDIAAAKAAGFDYMVEPDMYRGGVVFVSERVGAFFYVAPADDSGARAAMKQEGFAPYQADS